ncbi:hypothetical protein [Streptomyces sp. NPDC020681]|uniref:hypothetical protein n=1 Tax=Streptomyces sp. NPDC020681 TaxID=3365083 RepID=UPI0037A56D36
MSSKQDRKSTQATDQEEETVPDSEKPSTSAAEASSKAADAVDAIDDVLDEFDDLTLAELGFRKDEVVDPATIDEAIAKKVQQYVQKGGQ